MLDSVETMHAFVEPSGSTGKTSNHRNPKSALRPYSAQLARYEELSGLSLTVFDPSQRCFDDEVLTALAGVLPEDLTQILSTQRVCVLSSEPTDIVVYMMQVPSTQLIVGGISIPKSVITTEWIRRMTFRLHVPESQLTEMLERLPDVSRESAQRLLHLACTVIDGERVVSETRNSTQAILEQLGMVYEQLVLIQDLSQLIHPDIPLNSSADLILQRVQIITDTELSALVFRNKDQCQRLMNGPWGIADAEVDLLIEHLLNGQEPRIVVQNNLVNTSWGADFSTVRSIIAVPLFESQSENIWLLLGNPKTRIELGTEEANLLKSVGQILASHSKINDLFCEREEMTLSLIRSLVSTVEAKDLYTKGHSERVAIVARQIAEKIGFSKAEREAIYHSGLLHDIGKIGIDDQVLRKPGTLTDEEFQKMAAHPEIGYRILRHLKIFENLLDGVLYHHERYDGKGYPFGLKDAMIPLMARVMAVADSFDAMRSDRPYRMGMATTKIEDIFRAGAGTQWDPEVIEAFLANKSEIYRLWEGVAQVA